MSVNVVVVIDVTANVNLIKQILCEFLNKKAKEFDRVIVRPCKCITNELGEYIECAVRVEPTYEDTPNELLTSFDYYKGYGIEYGLYYPIGKLFAVVYLRELERRE